MNLTKLVSMTTAAALSAGLLAVAGTPLSQVAPVQANGAEGWSALGTGMPNGRVFSIAPASNGMVYAGGTFTSAGGVSGTRNIAQWNPTVSAWQAVGGGINNSGPNGANGGVFAVAHDPTTNRVFIGGDFIEVTQPDTSTLNQHYFAIWDVSNSTWNVPRGGTVNTRGFAYEGVEEISVIGSSNVYVGGAFRLDGDSTGDGFFRRTTAPSMAGVAGGIRSGGVTNGIVNGMVSDGGNGVVISGQFDAVSGSAIAANKVARWDGTSWSAFGGATSGPFDGVVAAVATTSGRVFIGGNFTKVQNAGTDVNSTRGLAMWNGTQWTSIGTMVGTVVEELRVIGDYLYVGGEFNAIGGVTATNIARYKLSTATWEAVSHGCTNGVNGVVRSIVDTGLGDGSIYVGGGFTDAGGVAEADRIAKYVPSTLGCSANTGGSSIVSTPTNFRMAGLVRDRVNGLAGMRAHLAWDIPAGGGGANFFVVTTKGLRSSAGFDESVEHPDLTCVTSAATCSIFFPFTSQVPSMNGRQYHQVIYSMQAYGLFGQSAPVSVGPLAQPDGTTASAPRNVQATAQWNRVTVTWDEPADFGSAGFATNYLVTSQPSNRVCIVTIDSFPATASARQCTFASLRSRVDYTFTVQALTFDGWGAASAPTTQVAQLDLDVTSAVRTKPFFSFPGTSRIRVSGVASGYAAGTPVRTFMEIGTAGWREVRDANVRVDGSGRILFTQTISPLYARRTVGVRFEIDTSGRCGEPFSSAGTCGQSNTEVMRSVW